MKRALVAILFYAVVGTAGIAHAHESRVGLGVNYSDTIRTVQADVDVLGHFGFQAGLGQDLFTGVSTYQVGGRIYLRRNRFISPYLGTLYSASLADNAPNLGGMTGGVMVRRRRGLGVYAQVEYLTDLRKQDFRFAPGWGVGLQWWF